MKHTISTIICLLAAMAAKAQIGYQVSLLDQATGAPRVNEYVTVKIDLTDNAGSVICSETHSATTNEFGVISVTIGDADTFARMDWSRLPLWISATVEGVVIGKSQVLNVPVAEYAKRTGWISATVEGVVIGKSQVLNVPVAEYAKRTGLLTKEKLCSKSWTCSTYYDDGTITLTFSQSGTATYYNSYRQSSESFSYEIDGNTVILYSYAQDAQLIVAHYLPQRDAFVAIDYDNKLFQ